MNALYDSDGEEDGQGNDGSTEQETDIDRPTLRLKPATTLTLPRTYTANTTYRQVKTTFCCGSQRGVSWLGSWWMSCT